MSVVTNIVIMTNLENQGTKDLNKWLVENDHPELIEVSEQWHKRKAMECEVWIGAFNYLPVDEFVEQYEKCRWDETPDGHSFGWSDMLVLKENNDYPELYSKRF